MDFGGEEAVNYIAGVLVGGDTGVTANVDENEQFECLSEEVFCWKLRSRLVLCIL